MFRLMGFPRFTINHKSQWGFQFITSEIFNYHNQVWLKNLLSKLFQSNDILKKLIVLWRFCLNIAGCVKKTSLLIWNSFYHISYGKHCFVKLFETSFVKLFVKHHSQGTDTFGSWNSYARQFVTLIMHECFFKKKLSF